MYPSGVWRGFWEQTYYGRQEMDDFHLLFQARIITGYGADVIGRFTFDGEYDPHSGRVALVKQYIGRHRVDYAGQPDGEGSILGEWRIGTEYGEYRGPFVMSPVWGRATGAEPILEL
jgi:hypothetical protein